METLQRAYLTEHELRILAESTAWYEHCLMVAPKNPSEHRITMEILTKAFVSQTRKYGVKKKTVDKQIEALLQFEALTESAVRVYHKSKLVFIGSPVAVKGFLLRTAFLKFWTHSLRDDDRETKRQRIVKQIDLLEAWNGKDHLHIVGHTVHLPANSFVHSRYGDEY